MLKKIMYFLSAVMLCSCVLFVPCFESKAIDSIYEFSLNYAEPSTSDTQGYLTLLWRDRKNAIHTSTFFWNCYATVNGVSSPCYAIINLTPSLFEFSIGGNDKSNYAIYSLLSVNEHEEYKFEKQSSSQKYSFDMGSIGITILGWKAKGNVGQVNCSFKNCDFDVYYCNDASGLLLKEVIELLAYNYNSSEDILDTLTSILNSVDGVENQLSSVVNYLKSIDDDLVDIKDELEEIFSKADEILNEEKKQTSLLEKIFEWLNESKEQEKQELQTQGNNSTSQGMNAIEDKGGDFAGSLGGLTNSMSYTGTQCAWEFPQVKLPAIAGVMGEIVLIEKQPIDFAVWVNAIPSDILLVVQSLCTAGLIIYCFKELYDTIAYVLTLRKDDNS